MRGIFVILSVAVIALIFASNAVATNGDDCYFEDLKLNIKRGESVLPEGECLRVTCTEDGEIYPEPCEMAIPPNCHVVDGDMSKEWPECCPSYECDEE